MSLGQPWQGLGSSWSFGGIQGSGHDGLTFDANYTNSSYRNLSETITINSVSVSPLLFYQAHNATASAWTATVGDDLAVSGSGTAPTAGRETPLLDTTNTGVLFGNGDFYQADNADFGNIGSDDVCVELLYFHADSNLTRGLLGKGAAGARWGIYHNTATVVRFLLNDGSNGFISSGTISAGSWNVIHCFSDSSDTASTGVRMFINGVSANSTTKNANLNIDNSEAFSLGRFATVSSTSSDDTIAHAAMWKRASWFAGGATNTTDWTAFAAERCAKIWGLYPVRSAGSPTPTFARATSAYTDKVLASGDRQLFLTGSGWARSAKRIDNSADGFTQGYLSEQSATNLILQSETIGTTWAEISPADSVNSSQRTAPNGLATGDLFRAEDDAVGLIHGVQQSVVMPASTTYIFSCFVKQEAYDYVVLGDGYVADGYAWFNLENRSVGTVQAGLTSAAMETDFLNDWIRCSIVLTCDTNTHTFFIASADTDGVITHLSSGQTNGFGFWGAQLERHTSHATPGVSTYIPTTTASASRNADSLLYASSGNWTGGSPTTLEAVASIQGEISGQRVIVALGSTANQIRINAEPSGDEIHALGLVDSGSSFSIAGPNNQDDGYAHSFRIVAATDNVRYFVDGVQSGSTDTSAEITASNGSIFVAGSPVNLGAMPIIVERVRIWRRELEPAA